MKIYDEAPTGAVLRARDLRRNSTRAEELLWAELRKALPQHKWRRQMPIGPFVVDFACHAAKLVIELDGGQHMATAEHDAIRTRFIARRGYRTLRFWNNEVLENISGILARVAEAVSTSPSRGSAAHPSPVGRGKEAHSGSHESTTFVGPHSAGRVRI